MVVQVALALVLLIGSGLMIRTFQALRNVQPGFTRPEEVQLLRISIPEAQVKEPERVMRMENEMLDKLAAIPGVTSVAFCKRRAAGRVQLQRRSLCARQGLCGRADSSHPAIPVRLAGVSQDHRHGSDRRARFHLDRSL